MEKVHELLGYHNIKIIQHDDMFSFSGDSMLLAHFVNVSSKTKKIIDLGCGKYKNAKLCALILDNGKEEFVYSD